MVFLSVVLIGFGILIFVLNTKDKDFFWTIGILLTVTGLFIGFGCVYTYTDSKAIYNKIENNTYTLEDLKSLKQYRDKIESIYSIHRGIFILDYNELISEENLNRLFLEQKSSLIGE